MTAEMANLLQDQMAPGVLVLDGKPRRVLSDLRQHLPQTVCMVPSLEDSHCVVAYRIENTSDQNVTRVYVYDNNYPEYTDRFIEISSSTPAHSEGVYKYEKICWQPPCPPAEYHTGLYRVPLSIYEGPHHAIGLLELARALVISVGVDIGPVLDILKTVIDILALPFEGQVTDGSAIPPPLFLVPATAQLPPLPLRSTGGPTQFAMVSGGRLLQLVALDPVPGTDQQVELTYENGRVVGYEFWSKEGLTNLQPRLATTPSEGRRIAALWSALQVPPGGIVGVRTRSDDQGVVLVNKTGADLSYSLELRTSDRDAGASGAYRFGPFEVPSGATHDVAVANWPSTSEVVSVIESDGKQRRTRVRGESCAVIDRAYDCDGDGIDDLDTLACDDGDPCTIDRHGEAGCSHTAAVGTRAVSCQLGVTSSGRACLGQQIPRTLRSAIARVERLLLKLEHEQKERRRQRLQTNASRALERLVERVSKAMTNRRHPLGAECGLALQGQFRAAMVTLSN